MGPKLDPTKLDEAISILDEYLGPDPVPAPPHVAAAWKTVRGEARRGRRISATALPAVATIAQHVSAAKGHAAAALEAMSVFGDSHGSSPSEIPPAPKEETPRR